MLASAIGIGLVAGLATGGRLSRLGTLQIVWWPILIAAVALRLIAGYLDELAFLAYLLAFTGVVAVAVLNRKLPGAWLIVAGSTLNLVVVAANGAMPVSRDAIAAVGGAFPSDALHRELDASSRLGPLSDVIPLPVVRTAYSVGDVLLAAGGFWLTFVQVRGR
jgi:hypothetical protein